jgi:type IV pilus assembly protein PilO
VEKVDKAKKQLVFLIILVFFGANYAIGTYAIIPSINNLKSIQAEYQSQVDKLNNLTQQKDKIEIIKAEIAKIKADVAELDRIAPNSIDTPQLVYDFYNACNDYGIIGETISFELREQGQDNSQQTAGQQQEAQVKNDQKPATVNIRLSINLKVKGDKAYIEEFLRNTDKITDRKLNVKSIAITAASTEEGEASNNASDPNVQLITPEDEFNGQSLDFIEAYELSANIVFYHYVQLDGQEYEKLKYYEFMDTEIGFESIADMFE